MLAPLLFRLLFHCWLPLIFGLFMLWSQSSAWLCFAFNLFWSDFRLFYIDMPKSDPLSAIVVGSRYSVVSPVQSIHPSIQSSNRIQLSVFPPPTSGGGSHISDTDSAGSRTDLPVKRNTFSARCPGNWSY